MISEKRIFFITNLYRGSTILQQTITLAQSPHRNKEKEKRGRAYRRNQNLITRLDAHFNSVAFRIHPSGTNSQYLCLGEFLDRVYWQVNARGGLCLGLDSLNKNTVQEGYERLYTAEGSSLDNTRALAVIEGGEGRISLELMHGWRN